MDMDSFIEDLKAREDLGECLWHQRLRPKKAVYKPITPKLPKKLTQLLKTNGITQVYSHQADALKLVRKGKNTVVMTPTASGKSLGHRH